jgi:hypothetical protein
MGGTEERLSPPSKGGLKPNHTVHVTAARLRFGVKGSIQAPFKWQGGNRQHHSVPLLRL